MVDLSLLVLVNVVELALLKVEFGVLVNEGQPKGAAAESVEGNGRWLYLDVVTIISLGGLRSLLQLLDLFLLELDLSEPCL